MKYLNTLLAFVFALTVNMAYSQDRYLEPIFEVEVDEDVTYGLNATILAFTVLGEAIPEELKMDVYYPADDVETERPLVIYAHTGNFLPWPDNGQSGGNRGDSTAAEICRRLASYGYVAASIDYRLGWNFLAPTQEERTSAIINAAYRGMQDARTCVRFFRKNAAENDNEYGIDPEKAIIWGQGTGGYISFATATLDEYAEVLIPKFFIGMVPMVIESVNGNIEGTNYGIVPDANGDPVDTLCYPNHLGYSSDFNMAINLGGALGDTSWIDENTIPMISFQTPTDPFAPYMCGNVLLPPPLSLPVIAVCGSYTAQSITNDLYDNNAAYAGMSWPDDYSDVANSLNDGYDGLFPFVGLDVTDSAPWDWWSPTDNPNHADNILLSPDMSPERARTYIDTIMAYVAPRACVTLGLDCNLSSTQEVLEGDQVQLQLAPNPASHSVEVQTDAEFPIMGVYLFDMNGKMLKAVPEVNNNAFTIQRGSLPPGIYVAKFQFEEGIVSKKIVFK